ncbi:MAG: CvpA family protein [Bacilli bacterium]|nr:CvpA family protein [Bacilli bacterium]
MELMIDALLVVIVVIGALRGWRYGGISAAVSLICTILVFIAAYYIKNPVASFLFEKMPFFKFGGMFEGISSLNILLYEAIAYLLCVVVLLIILAMIAKITHILDKLVNLTIILALPSKILGLVLGAIQYYIVVYFIVFILLQIPFTNKYMNDSELIHGVVDNTPLLSQVTNELYSTYTEVYSVCVNHQSDTDKEAVDYIALDTLMKHEIVTSDSVRVLKEQNKINIKNVDELIAKYEKKDGQSNETTTTKSSN